MAIDMDRLRARLGIEQEGGKPFGPYEAGVLIVASLGMIVMHFGGSDWTFRDLWGESLRGDFGKHGNIHPYFQLFGLLHWVGACVVGYMLIPMIYLKLCGRRIRDHYLGVGAFFKHIWIYLALVLPILGVVVIVSYFEDFQRIYPFYTQAGRSWFDLLIWELAYGVQFLALEFFFRGFLLHALRPVLGYGAIFVMLVPYCMIHFLKTAAESAGSLIAGMVLGTLAMKNRSIWGGVLAHWIVAIAMDWASMTQKGTLPTRFWPF